MSYHRSIDTQGIRITAEQSEDAQQGSFVLSFDYSHLALRKGMDNLRATAQEAGEFAERVLERLAMDGLVPTKTLHKPLIIIGDDLQEVGTHKILNALDAMHISFELAHHHQKVTPVEEFDKKLQSAVGIVSQEMDKERSYNRRKDSYIALEQQRRGSGDKGFIPGY